MNYELSRIEEAVLALLAVFSFDDGRAWKGFDFDVMDKLHAHGLINKPKGKAKSVLLAPHGLERGRQCAHRLIGGA